MMRAELRECGPRTSSIGVLFVCICMLWPATAPAQQVGKTGGTEKTEEAVSESRGAAEAGESADSEKLGPKVGGKRWPKDSEIYDPAWARYRVAFVTLAEGDVEGALEQLKELQKRYPGHPAALFSGPVIDRIEGRLEDEEAKDADEADEADDSKDAAGDARSDADAAGDSKRVKGWKRWDFIRRSTGVGVALGLEACGIVGCNTSSAWAASGMLAGGAGLGLSYWATRDGVDPALSPLLSTSFLWGGAYGLAVPAMIDPSLSYGQPLTLASIGLGHVAGVGTAYALYRLLEPTAPQVGMVNSGATWALTWTAIGLLGTSRVPVRTGLGAAMVTPILGGLGGGLLAAVEPMETARMWIVNASGVLGGFLGAGAVVLASGSGTVPLGLGTGSVILGSMGGLVLSGFATRALFDDEQHQGGARAGISVSPSPRGQGAVLSLGGRF